MAERDDSYDPDAKALEYATVNITSLFDQTKPGFKFSRRGIINFTIPWAWFIWGIPGVLIGALVGYLLFVKLLPLDYIGIAFTIALAIGVGYGMAMLGTWSPMSKSTGEDFLTYLMVKLRQRIGVGGRKGQKAISHKKMNSKMIGGQEGKIVDCQQMIGTQYITTAPPSDPYVENYVTPYMTPLRGERKVQENYHYYDGLGDRE